MSIRPEHHSDHMLEDHGLRKTTFRKEVLAIFLNYRGKALSNAQIEDLLVEYDRITLYRTLKSFEEKGLIHRAVDNTGNALYALCSQTCDELSHEDTHAHFHCHHCGNTTCLDEMPDKFVQLAPSGYHVKEVQITLSGVCETCA